MYQVVGSVSHVMTEKRDWIFCIWLFLNNPIGFIFEIQIVI